MEKKKMAFLGGGIFLLLLISFFIFSQLTAQDSEQFTQGDFVDVLIRALGLEDQLPLAATTMDKAELLRSLGYVPLADWNLTEPLSRGAVAVVLGQILGIEPVGPGVEGYIEALVAQGIMTGGGADDAFSLADLTDTINTAAGTPGWRSAIEALPYRAPVSPTS